MYVRMYVYTCVCINMMMIIIKDVRTRKNSVIYYGRDEVFSPVLVK